MTPKPKYFPSSLLTVFFLGLVTAPLSGIAKDSSTNHHPTESPASLWQGFMELQAGNHRFASGHSLHPKQSVEARKDLVSGQKPNAIVLSCSDSRVPPELIFDQGLGQIFTVRVAGEVPDASSVASIEYAIEHLGARILVVLGHDSCGAVKAALTTPIGKTAGSADLDQLIAGIRPHIKNYLNGENDVVNRSVASVGGHSHDNRLREPVRANVQGVVQDLIRRSEIIREFVHSKKLLVAQGIYALDTGLVEFWDGNHPETSHK